MTSATYTATAIVVVLTLYGVRASPTDKTSCVDFADLHEGIWQRVPSGLCFHKFSSTEHVGPGTLTVDARVTKGKATVFVSTQSNMRDGYQQKWTLDATGNFQAAHEEILVKSTNFHIGVANSHADTVCEVKFRIKDIEKEEEDENGLSISVVLGHFESIIAILAGAIGIYMTVKDKEDKSNKNDKPADGRKARAGKSSTPENEDGGHTRTINLDRHKVMAPDNQVLTGFGLRRGRNGNTIRYDFSHVAPQRVGSTNQHHTTQWDDEDAQHGYRNIFLDRHKVMAPEGHFLSGFHLMRDCKGKYRYEFWSRSAAMGVTQEGKTKANDWGGGAVVYLDKHMIEVPEGHGLRGFQLYRPTESTIAYRYWFAPLSFNK